jgi:hypothetical protein
MEHFHQAERRKYVRRAFFSRVLFDLLSCEAIRIRCKKNSNMPANMFEKSSKMKLESSCIPQADDAGVHGGAILPHPLPCLRHGWRPGE